MDSLYNWVVFVHIAGAFIFALAHGTSAAVALRMREERDVPRLQALLDLSQITTNGMYAGLFVLLGGGITAAFMAGLWGRAWLWTAIVILVAMLAFMYVRASRYFAQVRGAAGQAHYDINARIARPAGAPDPAALAALLASSRPMELAVVGTLGLLVIIWLMVLKPF